MAPLLVKFLADGLLLVILALSIVSILWAIRGRIWATIPILAMAGLTSLLVAKIMSLVYQPEIARPFMQKGVEAGAAYINNPGFPSDHALLATVAVVAVYALTRNPRLTTFLAFLVIAMCVGRVLALVHTPFDVIAGMIAGLSGAAWYKKLTK